MDFSTGKGRGYVLVPDGFGGSPAWGRLGLNLRHIQVIRRAFKPVAREILTDVLQILVPRLFVPLNLRVTLVTLYQGPQTPGDSILAVSLRCPRGGPAAERRVVRPPEGYLFSHLGPCGHHRSPLGPHVDPIGLHYVARFVPH